MLSSSSIFEIVFILLEHMNNLKITFSAKKYLNTAQYVSVSDKQMNLVEPLICVEIVYFLFYITG